MEDEEIILYSELKLFNGVFYFTVNKRDASFHGFKEGERFVLKATKKNSWGIKLLCQLIKE